MVRPIDYETDADFVALSFMDFCAPHAYEVAAAFRKRGKVVVAGGRYPSTFPDNVLPHFDSVVVGEAERIWPRVVGDLVARTLRKRYDAPFGPPLDGIPPPRYDLVEPQFGAPVVTEATRGCPYHCSFCHLSIQHAPYRKRPIADVVRDLTATSRLPLHKRKLAMLYDNNLGGDLAYAKELLREIAKLKLWALGVQFSFDCLQDEEFVDLLAAANCTMAFIGLESLSEPSLRSVHKKQNRVEEYKHLFARLRQRGIMTFTGLILDLDEDTPEYYLGLPSQLEEIDPSVILLSIAIPIPGTPLHTRVLSEGRILDHDLSTMKETTSSSSRSASRRGRSSRPSARSTAPSMPAAEPSEMGTAASGVSARPGPADVGVPCRDPVVCVLQAVGVSEGSRGAEGVSASGIPHARARAAPARRQWGGTSTRLSRGAARPGNVKRPRG